MRRASALAGLLIVLSLSGIPSKAAFPGRNGRILFFSDHRDGSRAALFSMLPDGSRVRELTNDAWGGSWSPDGESIVFRSDRDGDGEIFVMSDEGPGVTQLTNNEDFDHGPDWSGDGGQIVFVSDRDGDPDIYVMNADGTDQRAITTNDVLDSDPSWSANSSAILFRHGPASEGDIAVVESDGTGFRVIADSGGDDLGPDWGPQGQRVVFAGEGPAKEDLELYVTRVDRSHMRTVYASKGEDLTPAWSPNGRWIVFQSDRDGDAEIFKIRPDGTDLTRLTRNSCPPLDDRCRDTDALPDWRPR